MQSFPLCSSHFSLLQTNPHIPNEGSQWNSAAAFAHPDKLIMRGTDFLEHLSSIVCTWRAGRVCNRPSPLWAPNITVKHQQNKFFTPGKQSEHFCRSQGQMHWAKVVFSGPLISFIFPRAQGCKNLWLRVTIRTVKILGGIMSVCYSVRHK